MASKIRERIERLDRAMVGESQLSRICLDKSAVIAADHHQCKAVSYEVGRVILESLAEIQESLERVESAVHESEGPNISEAERWVRWEM